MTIFVLVISGSMGSGKTTVLGEASDLLTKAGIAHAAIDVDALSIGLIPDGPEDLNTRNLAAIWTNYAAAGVERLMIAEALDTAAKLDEIRRAIPNADVVVCRLRAGVDTMQQRVRIREPGMLQAEFVNRVEALEASLDRARIEDFRVDNDGRGVTEVAREVLARAGWL